MNRGRCRSWWFGYLADTLTRPERERIEAALRLLNVEHVEALYSAHREPRVGDIDWPAEAAAVDRLGSALEVLGAR